MTAPDPNNPNGLDVTPPTIVVPADISLVATASQTAGVPVTDPLLSAWLGSASVSSRARQAFATRKPLSAELS